MSTIKLKADELVLGDKVDLLPGEPDSWGTVINITNDTVEIFRPYVHIADFTYTGGVLHYIGTETVKAYRLGSRVFEVDEYTHERMSREGALK